MANFIVGLTGGIGSGKTTVSNMFAKLGINIVDADVIAREVIKPGSYALTQIIDHFGNDILLATGELNRALLREKIFADSTEKTWLNQLMHPLIRADISQALTLSSGDYCILSAPLLFENQLNKITDRNLVVDVPIEVQIKRTTSRDNVTPQQVQAIIDSQIARQQRLALADDVIDNSSSDLKAINEQVIALDTYYKTLANAKNAPTHLR